MKSPTPGSTWTESEVNLQHRAASNMDTTVLEDAVNDPIRSCVTTRSVTIWTFDSRHTGRHRPERRSLKERT